jgi:hypothetical protein
LPTAALCIALAAFPARADTVILKDNRKTTGRVRGIHADRIVASKGTPIPRKDVAGVEFEAEPVVAKPDGLILPDGSVLSGVLHALDKTSLRFRSTALGPLDLPLGEVAALYFGGPPEKASFTSPAKGNVRVVLTTGAEFGGDLFTASREGVLVRTSEGLEKIDFKKTRYVVFGPCRGAANLVLRNGDRIGRPVKWKGDHMLVQVADQKEITLTLEAIRSVEF